MTKEQRAKICRMRKEGYSYLKISRELALSVNTVSSYFRRNILNNDFANNTVACKQCGKPIRSVTKRKPRKFCSDKCRRLWWNSHPEVVNRKAIYHFTCNHCGQPFTAYGNKGRKYCSHSCYIADRYDKGRACNE